MDLIRIFCGFSLASCAALLMLPEGTLRKSASLAFGMMAALLWMDGLLGRPLPEAAQKTSSAIVRTESTLDQIAACEKLLSNKASAVAGCQVYVTLTDDGMISITPEIPDDQAAAKAAEALGIEDEKLMTDITR